MQVREALAALRQSSLGGLGEPQAEHGVRSTRFSLAFGGQSTTIRLAERVRDACLLPGAESLLVTVPGGAGGASCLDTLRHRDFAPTLIVLPAYLCEIDNKLILYYA